jgi:hypothetical protein
MKIILTENQMAAILETESVAQLLQESFVDSKNIDNLKRIIKRLLITGVAATSIITAINKTNLPNTDKEALLNAVMVDNQPSAVDTVFMQKVEACKAYMEYALNNQGYTLESTELKPETLVKASIENSFDLPFLMAVAHQESCFGATPRAQKTNSVFSVGSYDNGKNVVTYSDPNESVYGYIDLLNSSYIVNGKSLLDLLKPGGFVNGIGKRYAKDKTYEAKIKNVRNRILKKFPQLA